MVNISMNDFFSSLNLHDSILEKVDFNIDMKCLTLIISAVNFIEKNDEVTSYYDSIDFKCIFWGVVVYQFRTEKIDEYNDPLGYKRKYEIYSVKTDQLKEEINHFQESYKDEDDDEDMEFHSLELVLFPGHSMLSFVFDHLEIRPIEFLAFDYAVSSNRIITPWSGDKYREAFNNIFKKGKS